MITYNFKTKEVKNVLDDLQVVVNNSYVKIDCAPEEATVVKLFDTLFVGIPVEKMGVVIIGEFKSATTGVMYIKEQKVNFSIHGNILYLRKL